MKKALTLMITAFSLFSCKNTDDSPTPTVVNVENDKQKMEDNMLNIYDVVDEYKTNDIAVDEIKTFLEYLDTEINGTFENNASSIEFASKSLKYSTENIKNASRISATSVAFGVDESELLKNFNDETGIYEWNSTNQEFEFISDSENIVLKALDNGKDYILTMSNFDVLVHDSEEEIPTSLNIDFTVNGTAYYNHTFSVSIDQDKYTPNSVYNEIVVGDLTFKSQLSKSSANSKVEGLSYIQIKDTKVLEIDFSAEGNFTSLNNGDDVSGEPFYNFLNLATLSIAMDKTSINLEVEPDSDIDNLSSDEEKINYLNEKVTATMLFDNETIATGRFIEDPESGANLEMIFEDGTTSTADVYFGEGFEDLANKLKEAL